MEEVPEAVGLGMMAGEHRSTLVEAVGTRQDRCRVHMTLQAGMMPQEGMWMGLEEADKDSDRDMSCM